VVLLPCVDELTVRASPGVSSPRVGVLRRGTPLEWLGGLSPPDRLTLTVDRNVPAPLTVTASEPWLQVALPGDAGPASGWVFGGLVCRPALAGADLKLAVVGWSVDGRLALLEKELDSGACGFEAPSTLRIVEPATGRTVFELRDHCPAANLFLSRRAEVDEALRTHGIAPSWSVALGDAAALQVSFDRKACLRQAKGPCVARVLEGTAARAELSLPLDRRGFDLDGDYPQVRLVERLRQGARDVAVLEVVTNESTHTFHAVQLLPEGTSPEQAWRDALAGVHLSDGPDDLCADVILPGTATSDAAAQALERLRERLEQRLRRFYGKEWVGPACRVSASVVEGRLRVGFVDQVCLGCGGPRCARQLVFTVSRSLQVVREDARSFTDGSCDP
jgi:hypothetical protein